MPRADELKYLDREIGPDLTCPNSSRRPAGNTGTGRWRCGKEFGLCAPSPGRIEKVKWIALGLHPLALQRGDRGGRDRGQPGQGLMVEMAAPVGIGVWLFQDSLIDEVAYIIDHSDSRHGEGQEEVTRPFPSKTSARSCIGWSGTTPKG
jgi:long-chain acyl-CoA synthetase